jgi:GMP synthase (glutamine-hydrolysing)
MENYFLSRGYQISSTKLYSEENFPGLEDFDWLIIMGGPMGVYDEDRFPWLKNEKRFISDVIEAGKVLLGVCLGAQLIASVLGAKVYKNRFREIGWFPITRSETAAETILGKVLPETLEVFHWHGDTFDIPQGATLLASSEACHNQGFVIENRIVGFQFHLETTMEAAKKLINECSDELDGSRYVQSKEQMLSDTTKFAKINTVMESILQELENNNSV